MSMVLLMLVSWARSWRTDRSSPAWRALCRMRWAIWRARTQVKTCTRMSCWVEWGAWARNSRRRAGLHLAEGELGLGLAPVPGDNLGGSPSSWLVISKCSPKTSFFQRGPRAGVDGRGQPQVAGLFAVQLPGADVVGRGVMGGRRDLGVNLVPGPGGSCRGRRWRPAAQLPAAWPAWRHRNRGPDAGAARVNGSRPPGAGAVDHPAGVVGGQPADLVRVDDGAGGGGHGQRSRQSLAGTETT